MSRRAQIFSPIVLLTAFLLSTSLNTHARVVINEIFYHGPDGLDELEFVELHNAGDDPVDLSGWKFTKGLKFTFPAGARIDAGGFAVLCRNEQRFREFYPAPVLATFPSKLSNQGERLELSDARGRVVDTVKYQDSPPWPLGADGSSASLERICPDSGGDNFVNWAASPFSADGRRPAGTPGRTNANYSAVLPPVVSKVRSVPEIPVAGQPLRIEAIVRDAEGVADVQLLYRTVTTEAESPETVLPMREAEADGTYTAELPPQPAHRLIRFRLRATGTSGARRLAPADTEPRPAFSFYVPGPETAGVARGWILETPRNTAGRGAAAGSGARRPAAFVHADPVTGRLAVLDFLELEVRKAGWQLHFAKGDGLNEAGTVNLLARRRDRATAAELLAYEVYRQAGVATPLCQPVRLWLNGEPRGLHSLIEQPGRGFLRRQHLDDDGHLYQFDPDGKDAIGQHRKRTNERDGHDDLKVLLASLQTPDETARWQVIRRQFDVAQVVHYFAVATLLGPPDAIGAQYLAYHDSEGTGRWTLYPRDQDQAWGTGLGRTQAAPMAPLPFAAGSPAEAPSGPGSDYFARPLLTQLDFRRLYLARLRELLDTVFTEANLEPLFRSLGAQLETEVRLRAALRGQNPDQGAEELRQDIDAIRQYLRQRREVLIANETIRSAGTFSTDGLEKPVSRKQSQAASTPGKPPTKNPATTPSPTP